MKSKAMGMTRKLLSVLLALALVSMVPVSPAFAGEGEVPSVEGDVAVSPEGDAEAELSDEGEPPLEQAIAPEEEEAVANEPDSTDDSEIPESQGAKGIIP
ncbi:MAG: hypothetical protein LBL23_04060, partial [Coriobacteriales bacterium]|nr:hypothetical protein [Coriobacteriales bacterium]